LEASEFPSLVEIRIMRDSKKVYVKGIATVAKGLQKVIEHAPHLFFKLWLELW
jgi:hypothetical protein